VRPEKNRIYRDRLREVWKRESTGTGYPPETRYSNIYHYNLAVPIMQSASEAIQRYILEYRQHIYDDFQETIGNSEKTQQVLCGAPEALSKKPEAARAATR
jgi:hypothetical protein